MNADSRISVILPAKNEASTVGSTVAGIRKTLPDCEIIVVDDGSSDDTGAIAKAASAKVVRHDTSMGNGAAIKAGARYASGDVFVFMDADGQHDPEDIPRLLEQLSGTARLVVGARTSRQQASLGRRVANWIYNQLASLLSGQKVLDLTSGFRAAYASEFRTFLPLLPNGFSYPTTSTMAFLRAGFGVRYIPINLRHREDKGTSHIRPLVDGGRFLLIIFKVATLYSPLKVFFPISMTFMLIAFAFSSFTLLVDGRFTNFGALMFVTGTLSFLIGLVSEQVTTLLYLSTATQGKSEQLELQDQDI